MLGVVGVAGCCFDEELALAPDAPAARGGDAFAPLDVPPARGNGMCEPAGFEDEFHAGCCSMCLLPLMLPLPLPASLYEARV